MGRGFNKIFYTQSIGRFGCLDPSNHIFPGSEWQVRGILRSATDRVDFNKICVFCGKYCIYIDKCVFIVVKIKCVNFDRISDICDKVNFTTKLHTFYNT